jgi:hypothetical protein
MRRRPTALLVVALALCACAGPVATQVQAKQRVDKLTNLLSLDGNDSLKQTEQNLAGLQQALSSDGFKKAENAVGGIIASGGGNVISPNGSNIIATGGGNVISPNGSNIIATGGGNLTAIGSGLQTLVEAAQSTLGAALPFYQLAAPSDVQVVVDPLTGELKRVWNNQASLRFAYSSRPTSHQLNINIDGLPDRTTGTVTLAIGATQWRPGTPAVQPDFTGYAPVGDDTNQAPTNTSGDPTYASPDPSYPSAGSYPNAASYPTYPSASSYPNAGSYPSYPLPFVPTPTWSLQQVPGRIALMGNLAPVDPQSLGLALTIAPQGSTSKQIAGQVQIDQIDLTAATPRPAHVAFRGTVPTMVLTADLRSPNDQRFTLKGTLAVTPTSGSADLLQYSLDYDKANLSAVCDLSDQNAVLRLHINYVFPSTPGAKPTYTAALFASDDGSKIGDVADAPGEPNILLITYADGTVRRWAPLGGQVAPANTEPTPTPLPPLHL